MKPNFSRFDITSWLVENGIPYATVGDNISRRGNWIGVNCPFCVTPDTKHHMGINLNTKVIKCWRCSTKGTIIKLIMKIRHLSYDDVLIIVSTDDKTELTAPECHQRITPDKTIFPFGTEDDLFDAHRQYLIERNFDPDEIRYKYKVQSIGPVTDMPFMANRLLIPYIINDRIVTYTTRDITETAEQRYRAAEIEHSIIPIDHLLYNIHTVKDIAVVVEGCFDVWRMGPGFIAMGSLVWNSQRVLALKNVKRVFIMPDYETHAQIEWERLAYSITSIIPDVNFVEIDEEDPGNFTTKDVRNFRGEIFGKVY